jgi:putative Ca2+/H+ antiporter (TMEM165/GDT1 family)
VTPADTISAFTASLSLIALAEIGDKSQIVCMALAARHRHWPVLLGASTAFLLLNTLAVLFGAGVAAWVDERVVAAVVALLFAAFGIQALLARPEDPSAAVAEQTGRGVFVTTLSLIFLAEFGDKTQIAVAGLASNMAPLPVWLGATTALIGISALGIWVGRTLLQRMPTAWLHRISGGVFLLFAGIAGWQAIG